MNLNLAISSPSHQITCEMPTIKTPDNSKTLMPKFIKNKLATTGKLINTCSSVAVLKKDKINFGKAQSFSAKKQAPG